MAGAVLRRALLRGSPRNRHPRLRQARRGVRLRRAALRAGRRRGRGAGEGAVDQRRADRRGLPHARRRGGFPDGSRRPLKRRHRARPGVHRGGTARCGPQGSDRIMTTHTLSVLVENKPGVLAHVAGLFSRRAFNITSLSVGPTTDERVSRMTIVVDGETTPVDQVHKQLEKLVRVLKVAELHEHEAVERELALIKVAVRAEMRADLLEVATSFRANVVDLALDTIVLEAVCSPGRLDALLSQLERHGTCELVRTGLIAIGRGSQTITDDNQPALAVWN